MEHSATTSSFAQVYICHEGPNSILTACLIILTILLSLAQLLGCTDELTLTCQKVGGSSRHQFSCAFISPQPFCTVCCRQPKRVRVVRVVCPPATHSPGNSATFSGMTSQRVTRMRSNVQPRFAFVSHLPNPCCTQLETILSINAMHNCFMLLGQGQITYSELILTTDKDENYLMFEQQWGVLIMSQMRYLLSGKVTLKSLFRGKICLLYTCYSQPLVWNVWFPHLHLTSCTPFSFILQFLGEEELTYTKRAVCKSSLCQGGSERRLSWILLIRPHLCPRCARGYESASGFFSYPTSLRHQVRSETVISWHLCSAVSRWWLSTYPGIPAQGLYFIQPYWSSGEVWLR